MTRRTASDKQYYATNRTSIRASQARYYKKNRSHILVQTREHRKTRPSARYAHEYRLSHPCLDCGETDPIVLEFDHVRGEKKFSIGQRTWTYSVEEVKAEIEKCNVVCANCHRRRTAQRVETRHQVFKED